MHILHNRTKDRTEPHEDHIHNTHTHTDKASYKV
jgi:hypothetical protein